MRGKQCWLEDLIEASQPLAAKWMDQQLGVGVPRKVGTLRGCNVANEIVELDWERWCKEAQRELEHNTASSFPDLGSPYKYLSYDPCRRAAQGVARSRGVPVGPSRQHMMRWTVRRLQELLARFRDERWELHSPRPG